MDTKDAPGLPQRLELDLETPVAGVFDRVLAGIKPYKEFVVLIAALAGAAIGLHDYFITRIEVRVLNCRSLAQMKELEGRIEIELLKEPMVRAIATQPPTFSKAPFQSLTAEERAIVDAYIQSQSVRQRNDRASKAVEEGQAKLQAGRCEALVKENKDT